jgi:hypothetical protein
MRPIRFCMVSSFYPPWSFGGEGLFVQDVAEDLRPLLNRLASGVKFRRKISARGGNDCLRRWTPDTHIGAYFDLIERHASRRGGLELARAAGAA